MNRLLLIMFFIFVAMGTIRAQEPDSLRRDTIPKVADSLAVDSDTTETRRERRQREKREREAKEQEQVIFKDSARLALEALSNKAWKRSLAIPGWGQYTNGGLWWIKVPVIYGGFVSTALIFEFNNRYYSDILEEVQYRLANNHAQPPNTKYPNLPTDSWATERLINAKDVYRRNRDLSILITVGWWGINAIEAYVNSMLKYRWDIGDDLGFKVTPTLLPQPATSLAYQPFALGVKVSINIGK
ncbi:DUF5683 domain-containing protein [Parapedobacter tibetensis]|uniref:DUF5683 domain-containing protein n=1 Tax=Parapedobacter tibetensis TaxID=2972951 RepID=UPI00214D1A44|nr:DUF5683 domain-containing protein [Parapedobacter tibetensis]